MTICDRLLNANWGSTITCQYNPTACPAAASVPETKTDEVCAQDNRAPVSIIVRDWLQQSELTWPVDSMINSEKTNFLLCNSGTARVADFLYLIYHSSITSSETSEHVILRRRLFSDEFESDQHELSINESATFAENVNFEWQLTNSKATNKPIETELKAKTLVPTGGLQIVTDREPATDRRCIVHTSVWVFMFTARRLYHIDSLLTNQQFSPRLISLPLIDDETIVSVVCGNAHVVILTSKSTVFAFGTGSHGELGQGTVMGEMEPTRIDMFEGVQIVQIAAAGWHTIALTDCNDVYVWGWNESGQLSLCSIEFPSSLTPYPLEWPDTLVISKIACGTQFSAVLTECGRVFVCGKHRVDDAALLPISDQPPKNWRQVDVQSKSNPNAVVSNISALEWTLFVFVNNV